MTSSTLAIIVAYLIGSVPFALLLARRWGAADPRTLGSGNLGAANVLRASGIRAGVIVAVLDVAKGAASVALAMRIASTAKAFSGAAALSLVDQHCLSLRDTIGKWLPKLPKAWRSSTLAQALSHTSGLPFASPLEQPTLDMLPLSAGVRSYAMSPLQFEPDSKYQYSNAGTVEAFARGLRLAKTIGDKHPAYRYEREVEDFFRHSPAVIRRD